MCQGKSGDKSVIPAQTMSLVQRSDGKIKAVWFGRMASVRRSGPGDYHIKENTEKGAAAAAITS